MEGMNVTEARREEPPSVASASVSQPDAARPSPKSALGWKAKKEPTSEATASVSQAGAADGILQEIRSWYSERVGDPCVEQTWQHLHSVLFKKVRC